MSWVRGHPMIMDSHSKRKICCVHVHGYKIVFTSVHMKRIDCCISTPLSLADLILDVSHAQSSALVQPWQELIKCTDCDCIHWSQRMFSDSGFRATRPSWYMICLFQTIKPSQFGGSNRETKDFVLVSSGWPSTNISSFYTLCLIFLIGKVGSVISFLPSSS